MYVCIYVWYIYIYTYIYIYIREHVYVHMRPASQRVITGCRFAHWIGLIAFLWDFAICSVAPHRSSQNKHETKCQHFLIMTLPPQTPFQRQLCPLPHMKLKTDWILTLRCISLVILVEDQRHFYYIRDCTYWTM